MANFASKEGTLGAGVAQTFNFKALLGVNATSLVYSNDDASSTHTLAIDGFSFKVLPGEERVLSGVENWEVLTIGGDAGSTGAYRCYATSSVVPATIIKPQGGPITTSAIADGAVTDAKLAKGSHVIGTALSTPFPFSVLIFDIADATATTTYTGLVGKHELFSAYMMFDGTTAAGTTVDVQTSGGASICLVTAGVATTGLTKFGVVTVANATIANGASLKIVTNKAAANVNGRLVVFMLPVA